MKQRVLTAVIGIPVLIAVFLIGNWLLAGTVAFLTIMALHEYTNALNKGSEVKINFIFVTCLSALILILMKINFYAIPFGIVICFFCCMAYEVYSKTPSFYRAAEEIFFLIYVPLSFGFLMMFENAIGGKFTIWMCLLAPFATDTFAYFGGKRVGGKKLTTISPNKTIAGSVIGLIATVIVLTLYGWILDYFTFIHLPLYYYSVLGIIASFVCQIGDLSASLIKRTHEIKDFGTLLPGHGGILDRFDSVLFVIPVIYMFTYYFLG